MGSFIDEGRRVAKRFGKEVSRAYKRTERELHRADDALYNMVGSPSPGDRKAAERTERHAGYERTRIGPKPSLMTGGLQDFQDKDKLKRRRRYSLMTGLGTLNTSKPKLGT